MHTGYGVLAPSTTVKQNQGSKSNVGVGITLFLYLAEKLKARQPGFQDESKLSGCGSSSTQEAPSMPISLLSDVA